jgi:putative ABC transport system substrate-binding protein
MPDMRRREFVTLLGVAAAWSMVAGAQQLAIPVIGLIGNWSRDLHPSRLSAFRQALNETGYVEGQSVAIEYHWAEGRFDLMPDLVADLLRRGVTVIATPGLAQAALAAKAAAPAVPIVFAAGEDIAITGLYAAKS